jgi:cell division protein FtsB
VPDDHPGEEDTLEEPRPRRSRWSLGGGDAHDEPPLRRPEFYDVDAEPGLDPDDRPARSRRPAAAADGARRTARPARPVRRPEPEPEDERLPRSPAARRAGPVDAGRFADIDAPRARTAGPRPPRPGDREVGRRYARDDHAGGARRRFDPGPLPYPPPRPPVDDGRRPRPGRPPIDGEPRRRRRPVDDVERHPLRRPPVEDDERRPPRRRPVEPVGRVGPVDRWDDDRRPLRRPPVEVVDAVDQEVVAAVPRPRPAPEPAPESESPPEVPTRRRPAEPDEPDGPDAFDQLEGLDDDDDDDEAYARRPPSWYRRGDDDAPPAPRKRVVAPADARVQPAVAASRRAHPTARGLGGAWPGGNAGGLPPDFPGNQGGDVVFRKPRRRGAGARPGPADRGGKGAKGTKGGKGPKAKGKSGTARVDRLDRVDRVELGDAGDADPRARRSLPRPLRPPQRFNNIVAAVYAALADPLAADSAEAREQRAARVREVGLIAASSALVAVLVYGIFPVRTFLNQRSATADARERLEKITEENERMRREAERLREDDEVELRARADYGWVFPGEESYGVLPSPVAEPTPDPPPDGGTTTTTTSEG